MTVVDKLIGSAPFVCEGDPVSGIEAAARLGYDGVELHFTDPLAANAGEIRTALRRTGLGVTALGTGRAYVNDRLSITDADEAGRLAALERLGRSMAHLDEAAGREGVEIVFEPINRYENNFLCTMADISGFVRTHGLKHTGLLIDTFHMNIEEADLPASILACAPEIKYVHLADSNRRYPGQGHLDLAGVLGTLRRIGYDGVLSAECLPLPTKQEAAAGWLAAVRKLLDN